MTNGSLRCAIPTLEPDEDLVDRLAELAAASRPTRGGVVVPVAFGGPASRAVVIAATVAAVTAGAAAAATQLSDARHDVPAPPGTSVGIQRPDGSTPARHDAGTTRVVDRNDVSASDKAAHNADGHTSADVGTTGDAPTTNDPASPGHHGPSDTTAGANDGDDQGDDQGDQGNHHAADDQGDGDDNGDQGGSQDGDNDSTGDDTGSGGDEGDTGGGDDGGSGQGAAIEGGQDDGGTQAGSEGGSGAVSRGDPSSVLIGSSD